MFYILFCLCRWRTWRAGWRSWNLNLYRSLHLWSSQRSDDGVTGPSHLERDGFQSHTVHVSSGSVFPPVWSPFLSVSLSGTEGRSPLEYKLRWALNAYFLFFNFRRSVFNPWIRGFRDRPRVAFNCQKSKNKQKNPPFFLVLWPFYFVHNVMLCGSTISLLCKKTKKKF